MCNMTHSYAWHDSFICVTWLIHMCDVTYSYVWQNSFMCVTWLIHMCDMTHSCVWHGSFIRVTWLIHMCDIAHLYVWYGSFIRVTWLIHMRDMTHSSPLPPPHSQAHPPTHTHSLSLPHIHATIRLLRKVHGRSHVIHAPEIAYIWGTWLIYAWDVTRSWVWHDWVMYVRGALAPEIDYIVWDVNGSDPSMSVPWPSNTYMSSCVQVSHAPEMSCDQECDFKTRMKNDAWYVWHMWYMRFIMWMWSFDMWCVICHVWYMWYEIDLDWKSWTNQ